MISKINALCYAYEAYGRASAVKDREAMAEAAREMARIRAEIKRELKPKKRGVGPVGAARHGEGDRDYDLAMRSGQGAEAD